MGREDHRYETYASQHGRDQQREMLNGLLWTFHENFDTSRKILAAVERISTLVTFMFVILVAFSIVFIGGTCYFYCKKESPRTRLSDSPASQGDSD
ncbi:unnamed protein product, partial [Mesorhabditis belari]|uniref:Uncharacterized protein n=1 Tax=Mesorhabditis belari TaxID=2138241 RepID=A0AAF3EAC0_9BILA